MKEQINRYARGAFEYETLATEVYPVSIDDAAQKNKEYIGTLNVRERLGRDIKGLVYSSNSRVQVVNSQFIGSDNVIEYRIDTTGIEAGDSIKGAFGVVTNGGEEQISYDFKVEAGSYDSEYGNVKNLFHFANLAQSDINEAVRIFTMPEFNKVLLKEDLRLGKLHDQLLKGSSPKQAVEEFLVATHKKNKVNISLSHTQKIFDTLSEDVVELVSISKDVWGVTDIKVSCDNDFVELSKDRLSEEDFAGGILEYPLCIRKDRLHAGRNYARVSFETVYQTLDFTVIVDNISDNQIKARNLEEKRNIVKLVNTYMNFKLRKINIGKWISESKEALEQLIKLDEDNPFYCLVMCQVLITEKRNHEAKFYLECAKDSAIEGKGSDPALYCYYLYVNTIYNRDSTYARETAALVKSIYEKECNDWRILWILLYLDEEMSKNKSLKLLRLKEQYRNGMRSPVLYLEACVILNEQPMLLRVLNEFELNVLLFGCKSGMIENRLVKQAAELAIKENGRPDLVLRLLKSLYNISHNVSVLEAICSLLIKNGLVGSKYLLWYSLGLEKELRVTKLFEYYMASRDLTDTSPLPKMVMLYFGYNNDLDYVHKAYLYANVIRYKNDNPQIFKNYLEQMQEFINEQLIKGRSDERTGIVFSHFLTADMINEVNAHSAADAVFTYKITCANKNMRNVIIGHKETTTEAKYPIKNGCAYVSIFTEEPCICFEDGYGRRYSESIDYEIDRVYEDMAIIKSLEPYCEGKLNLELYFCEKMLNYQETTLDNVRRYFATSRNEKLCFEFKQRLVSAVIDYYYDNYEGKDTFEVLEGIEYKELSEVYLAKYIEALAVQGCLERAFEISKEVRMEKLNPKRMLRLCSRLIAENMFLEDGHLVKLAFYAFSKGKYDDNVLSLLVKEYNGTTSDMISLWDTANDNKVDTYLLEERILGQMLFSGHYSGKTTEIFEHYYNNGAKERLTEAYLAYNSYMYFVRDILVADSVFEIIEARLELDRDVILVCRLALLKYYSELEKLSVTGAELAKRMINELSRKGYVFPFYTRFADKFPLPYLIADKTMVEFKTNPLHRVVIHYIYENSDKKKNYISMDMKNVYEGIFVSEFVLFYGEAIQYFITEETPGGEMATESSRLEGTHINMEHSQGRYEDINEIIACRQLHDSKTLDKLVHSYGVKDIIVNQIFKPID